MVAEPASSLGIVVVTHRSEDVLDDLLDGLAAHEPEAPVVVVDSGSPEGPPEVPNGVDVVALKANVGYGAACNVGARHLGERGVDTYAFLNPDVRLQGPSLSELSRALAERERSGMATGPVVDEYGRRVPSAWGPTSAARAFAHASGFRLDLLRRLLVYLAPLGKGTSEASARSDRPLPVTGHVLGGAMVVRRQCFQEINGFDERFFLYWEDADLCVRARQHGWEVWVLPATPIVHLAGTSSANTTSESRFRHYLDGAHQFAELHLDERAARRLLLALHAGWKLRRRTRG